MGLWKLGFLDEISNFECAIYSELENSLSATFPLGNLSGDLLAWNMARSILQGDEWLHVKPLTIKEKKKKHLVGFLESWGSISLNVVV